MVFPSDSTISVMATFQCLNSWCLWYPYFPPTPPFVAMLKVYFSHQTHLTQVLKVQQDKGISVKDGSESQIAVMSCNGIAGSDAVNDQMITLTDIVPHCFWSSSPISSCCQCPGIQLPPNNCVVSGMCSWKESSAGYSILVHSSCSLWENFMMASCTFASSFGNNNCFDTRTGLSHCILPILSWFSRIVARLWIPGSSDLIIVLVLWLQNHFSVRFF